MEITCKDLQRFWNKVRKSNNCWIWVATKNKEGYGKFWFNKKHLKAHRFAYEMFIGLIPKDLTIDHLCRNPSCVNPEHLESVTLKENILRGKGVGVINSKKTHCIHGHEFTEENTYIYSNGDRKCRTCRAIGLSNYRRRRKNNGR